MYKFEQRTVALVADSFNLAILNQIWLVDNRVVTKDEINEADAFQSPVAINISCPSFELLTLQDRLQVTIRNTVDRKEKILRRIVGNFAKALPHTPFKAIGINFKISVTPSDLQKGLQRASMLHFSTTNPLTDKFSSGDSRFGGYMSTNSLFGTRLRLDIKPHNLDGVDRQILNLNYHFELSQSEDKVADIIKLLANWELFEIDAKEIATLISDYLDGE